LNQYGRFGHPAASGAFPPYWVNCATQLFDPLWAFWRSARFPGRFSHTVSPARGRLTHYERFGDPGIGIVSGTETPKRSGADALRHGGGETPGTTGTKGTAPLPDLFVPLVPVVPWVPFRTRKACVTAASVSWISRSPPSASGETWVSGTETPKRCSVSPPSSCALARPLSGLIRFGPQPGATHAATADRPLRLPLR